MWTIFTEGVVFVALIAAAGALVLYGVLGYTPLGRSARQIANRRRIERLATERRETHCAAHGDCAPSDLVRLPDGSLLCPTCYAETFGVPPRDQRS